MGVPKNVDNSEKIITVPKVQEAPLKGLGEVIFEKMQENQGITAQIDGITGEKETYDSLLLRSIRVAIAMRQRGVTSEDIISICSTNHLDVYLPFLASIFLGAKLANLDPSLPLSDTVHLLKQVTPKMIFVEPQAVKLIQDGLAESKIDAQIVVFGDSIDHHKKFSDFLLESPEEQQFKPVEIEDVKKTCLIMFSSGTTGLPKGICLSHYALLNQAYQSIFLVAKQQIILMFSTMYWHSSAMLILNCVLSKSAFVIYPKFDPSVVWSLIEKHHITVLGLAASRMLATVKKGSPKGMNVSSLRLIIITGTTMTANQIEQVKTMVPTTMVANTYGLTEACGISLSFRPATNPNHVQLMSSKANSCGTLMAGFSYKLVDVETEELLGPYQKGELRLKTDFQMNGYYKIDSSSCWDEDGWLKTGDVAYYDEDYCFYIVDRIKEIFKYQCWHIVPTRLEEVLLTHPAVQAAIVVPLPHEEDGNHPVGVVALNELAGDVTAKEIELYVEQQVDDRQRLRGGVRIVKELPYTPSGKVRRREVVKMVKEGAY